jgi:hypothetical protein
MIGVNSWESGLIDRDAQVHAVHHAIRGPRAACGAGRITDLLAGRFDPADAFSCVRCAALLRGQEARD